MSDWQPISSAPRSGEDILIFEPGNGEDWDRISIAFWWKNGLRYQHDDHLHVGENATHWAPLPAKPDGTGQGNLRPRYGR